MRIELFGVRGTFPSATKERTTYGGHTLCTQVTTKAGTDIIIDAGTGIRPLGDKFMAARRPGRPLRLSLLFTHFHLDHIVGLPFFGPLYDETAEIDFYSWREPEDLREILGRFTASPFYPVPFEETPALKRFHGIGPAGLTIDTVRITTCPLHHPQGSVAYRLIEESKAIVLATDTEHPVCGLDDRLEEFSRKSGVLVYDAMFTPEEYTEGRVGWGHSTWREGVRLARAAGVGRLLLSHLNPDHSDRTLNGIARHAGREFRSTACASEGLTIEL